MSNPYNGSKMGKRGGINRPSKGLRDAQRVANGITPSLPGAPKASTKSFTEVVLKESALFVDKSPLTEDLNGWDWLNHLKLISQTQKQHLKLFPQDILEVEVSTVRRLQPSKDGKEITFWVETRTNPSGQGDYQPTKLIPIKGKVVETTDEHIRIVSKSDKSLLTQGLPEQERKGFYRRTHYTKRMQWVPEEKSAVVEIPQVTDADLDDIDLD